MASEMTNEELANWLAIITGSADVGLPARYREYLRDAAARLRLKQQSDNYAAALAKQEAEYKREICDLRRRLNVAKDALECADWLVGRYCPNPALEGDRKKVRSMNRAIAVIRDEGGAK